MPCSAAGMMRARKMSATAMEMCMTPTMEAATVEATMKTTAVSAAMAPAAMAPATMTAATARKGGARERSDHRNREDEPGHRHLPRIFPQDKINVWWNQKFPLRPPARSCRD